MEQISSRENPHVKQLAALLARKKDRDETGLFAAEGLRLCADVLESGLPVETLLVTQRALERYPRAKALAEKAGRVLLLSQALAERVAGTETTQGVFCISPKKPEPALDAIRRGGLYLLLADLQDPGNIGAIVRTAEALGLDGIVAAGCPDFYAAKVLRASMGGVFRLPIWNCGDFEQAVQALRAAELPLFAAVAERSAQSIEEISFHNGGAILIGNEGSGLTQEQAAACGRAVFIPMAGRADSLGAAAAAGILIWEMTRARRKARD